jgi:quinol monooxygenase YgiN
MMMRPTPLFAVFATLVVIGLPLAPLRWAGAQKKGAPPSAPAFKEGLYVVTHVDILPDLLTAAVPLLRQYVADSRRDPGALRVELLQQADRTNHFTIVSVWENEKAFNAHLAAAHTREFRAKVQPMLGSPFDERLHHLMP